ncbi:MAG: mitochondrial fission ELM1 family protein [Pseudomonadota bacterium]
MTPGRPSPPCTWALLGQKAGDNNQVLALAEALGWPYEVREIRNRPWELLANVLAGTRLWGVDRRRSSPLQAPWPELVISAGRRNEPVARWLRNQSGGRARLVHLGRPWAPLAAFDLIVTTPQYFLPAAAANVVHNRLPLHRVDPERARAAAAGLEPELAALPRPRTLVLLGGDSGPFVFTAGKARRLASRVDELLATTGGAVLATDSRRTPAAASAAFRATLRAPCRFFGWRDPGPGRYLALLGAADRLVLTAESMSMLAEALAMEKPLHLFSLHDPEPWWRHRHAWRAKPLGHRLAMAWGPRRMRRDITRLLELAVAEGRARWLDEPPPPAAEPAPAPPAGGADLERAARRVRALFGR